jgi:nucleotide-binding universal stress UspA family protein
MYTRILIPLDGSSLAEQVLPCGRFLAKALRIPVQLLRVIDGNEIALTSKVSQGLRLEKLLLQSRLRSRTYLEAVARSVAAAQVSCSVDAGNPAEVINENASADKNTLIVTATHGGSGIRRWLLGSVAHQLLQESANDMFLIRVTDEGRPAVRRCLGQRFYRWIAHRSRSKLRRASKNLRRDSGGNLFCSGSVRGNLPRWTTHSVLPWTNASISSEASCTSTWSESPRTSKKRAR